MTGNDFSIIVAGFLVLAAVAIACVVIINDIHDEQQR